MLNNQTASPLIQVNALTKRYGDGENIFENVNFNIQKRIHLPYRSFRLR